MAQKLSLKAAKDKKDRDLAAANTPGREKKRAECQKERRAAVKEHGANWLNNKDYDHTKKRFVSVKQNRGGYGNGTKNS